MFQSKYHANTVNAIKLPKLKGHLKIVLKNRNGSVDKVIEGDNTVTNAVRDIFANNYFGGIDYSKCMPLYQKWYGGIICYANAHLDDTDADAYFPEDNTVNPVTAHAGNTAPSDIADDLKRGSPNTDLQVITSNSVTLAWEWGLSQGAGAISAISLTHADTGNAGLGSTSAAFQAFTPFEIISGSQMGVITTSLSGLNNVFTQYDANHGLAFYIGEDGEYKAGKTKFSPATQKVSVYIKRVAYSKAGLFESTLPVDTVMSKFTVTTHTNFYMQPAYYFDYENKYLWLFTNRTGLESADQQNISYTKIDCTTGTELDYGTIVSDTINLAPIVLDRTSVNTYNQPCFTNIVKQGNYMYFPTTSMNMNNWNWNNLASNSYSGFKKINITNTTDQSQVNFSSARYRITSGVVGGGLVVHDGSVTNGATAYTCQYAFPAYDGSESALLNEPESISTYMLPLGNNRASTPRYIFANKLVNTTLYNLAVPVTKTTNQSMLITYTLTETSS